MTIFFVDTKIVDSSLIDCDESTKNRFFYLTGVHFRGELQHVSDVSEQKIKCWPIKTREIGSARL